MKKILLLLFTAIIITFITPSRALLDSTIHKGEVWEEETLIAPFDIPIYKSKAVIEQEREEITRNFQPIFRLDTSATHDKVVAIISFLEHQSKHTLLLDTVEKYLKTTFHIGIIPATELTSYRGKFIRISNNDNEIRTLPIDELLTPEQIIAKLKGWNIEYAYILDYIRPNLTYDDQLNHYVRTEELSNISKTRSMVRTGETVVTKGQIIDDQTELVLNSYRLQYEDQIGLGLGIYDLYAGRFLLIISILMINFYFFNNYAKRYFDEGIKPWLFVTFIYLLFSVLTAIAVSIKEVSPYLIPLPVVAIYLLSYFNVRVAIIGNITIAIIGAMFVRIPFDFFMVNFMAGMVAIFALRYQYRSYNIIKAMGLVFLTQLIVFTGVSLLRESDITAINYMTAGWFLLNVFLILAFYQTVYLFERIFGFISSVSLLELCDTNQPLLLKLAETAPGTFQHSLQVANLAEAAAKEIGANPLLARTGALYHDVGKIKNPLFFTENQAGGINPHNDITPLESARIIRNHVTDGVSIANKHRLPQQVIDFIQTHHGTSIIYYFYVQHKELYNTQPEEGAFSYPGPKPISKETTICMMADSIEAASHSLEKFDKESLENLVDKIIEIQINGQQFSESELSFHEVEKIKQLLKDKLNNIYHARISYPEREKE